MRIAGFADDTYLNAPPAELYDAYAHKRRACQGPAKPGEPPACELSSNLTKVHASSPRGAIADIPPSGGDVAWAHGFKCVGVYKGPDAWVQEQTEAELLKRLAPLDFIDKLTDDEKTVNATQIKKILITDCAALQGVYWAQAQRPALSAPGLGAALARIRVSWEALVGADASPETRRDLAWEQACSPTNMGGCGIYNAHALSGAAYAASVIKNWPLLQRVAPALHDVDFATTTLPSIAAARDAYETLRAERDRIAQVHAAYDGFEYHTIHGDKLPRFRPHSLTPAARLPAPARLFLPDDDDKVPTPPSQKALSSIVHHGRWLAHIDAMHEFDRTADDTNISHREATRFVSASQFGAGMWLEAAPDASLPNSRLKTAPYTAALQRRLGLYLSAAKAANDTLAAAGKTPDWLGDASCNLGEHSTRHHATNRAWRDALAAVATGTVLLGDKQEAHKYKQYNEGHVADIVQIGASPWGTDWLGETKVPSSLSASPPDPGCEAVGHMVGFGATEEGLHRTVLGCAQRGAPQDGPFNHNTGKGHVPFFKGNYHDARHVKRNQVVPLIVEALGGIGRRGARCLRFLARRAKDRKRGRDGTRYSRFHPSNFLSHHMARIVTAAVYADAEHICDGIVGLKQHALELQQDDDTTDATAAPMLPTTQPARRGCGLQPPPGVAAA